MTERYLRQSALAHLGLVRRARDGRGEAGVAMAEHTFPGIVDLRLRGGDKESLDAAGDALGAALPREAGAVISTDGAGIFWLGPDEWWIVTHDPDPEAGPRIAAALRARLAGRAHGVTNIGEAHGCIRLAGPKARASIQKGCPLDLHPRAFAPDTCARSLIAKATAVIHLVGDDPADGGGVFDLYVARSFADYLWHWLEDAAREYGVAIVKA